MGDDSFNEKEKDNIYNSFLNNNESLNIKNDLKEFKPFTITSDIINNLLNTKYDSTTDYYHEMNTLL